MKKIWLGAGIGIAVVIIVSLGIFLIKNNENKTPVAINQTSTVSEDETPACLAHNDELQIYQTDLDAIQYALENQMIDTPGATGAALNFATYNRSQASGSLSYPGGFGTFNFKAQESQGGTWEISSFVRCEPEV
jgi:hypothetical protein